MILLANGGKPGINGMIESIAEKGLLGKLTPGIRDGKVSCCGLCSEEAVPELSVSVDTEVVTGTAVGVVGLTLPLLDGLGVLKVAGSFSAGVVIVFDVTYPGLLCFLFTGLGVLYLESPVSVAGVVTVLPPFLPRGLLLEGVPEDPLCPLPDPPSQIFLPSLTSFSNASVILQTSNKSMRDEHRIFSMFSGFLREGEQNLPLCTGFKLQTVTPGNGRTLDSVTNTLTVIGYVK